MNKRVFWWGATAALAVSVMSAATARPGYLGAFKTYYKTAAGKPKLNAANCALCHIGPANQGKWNAYGTAYGEALGAKQVGDMAKLAAAFAASEKKVNPATKETYAKMIAADLMPGGATGTGGNSAAPAGSSATLAVAGDWEPVFNGLNLDGWTKMGGGNWMAENFLLKYTGGGNGWVRTNKMYTNYSAVIRWRFTQPGANNDSGIFLKIKQGDTGALPNSPQLHMGPNQNYGALLNKPTRFDLIKPNDWNVYTITVQNGLATVAINGTPAWDYAESDALKGPGYLGIEAAGRPIEIDSFWVRPLQ